MGSSTSKDQKKLENQQQFNQNKIKPLKLDVIITDRIHNSSLKQNDQQQTTATARDTKINTKRDLEQPQQQQGDQDFDLSQSGISQINKTIIEQEQNIQQKLEQSELIVQKSGILLQSLRDTKLIQEQQKCYYCSKSIDQVFTITLPCKHSFHYECFVRQMEDILIIKKKSTLIKCKCGSKLNSNLLRQIQDPQFRMRTLNFLFSNQLEQIFQLADIKKAIDYQQLVELYEQHKYTEDYDYTSSSGFLYQSNQTTPGGD